MQIWAEAFLQAADTAHSRYSPQTEGELSLAELSRRSEVEYAWDYDETANVWHYAPGDNIKQREVNDGIVTSSSTGLTVHPSQHYPQSTTSFFYHIHPKADETIINDRTYEQTFPVQNQLPSQGDIETCIRFTMNGYKGFRIVTALGITSLDFDLNRAVINDGAIKLQGMSVPLAVLAEDCSREGTAYAIEKVFDRFNAHFSGMLRFQFNEWK